MLKARRLYLSIFSLWLFFIFFFTGIISGSFLEDESHQARKLYSEGNYFEAKRRFEMLCLDYPFAPEYTIFKLMLAKCEYNLKDYPAAEKDFEELVSDFPASRFVPVSYFYLGNIHYLNKDYFTSALNYISAYQGGDPKTKSLAFKSIVPLLEYSKDPDELRKLIRKDLSKELLSEIYYFLGKKELKQKDFSSARKIFKEFEKKFPQSPHLEEVQQLLLRPELLSRDEIIKIGILAPLSGEFSSYGHELVNGIKLGIESGYPQEDSLPVRLLLKDTESNPAVATKKTKELIQEGVSAILGPLTSEESLGAGFAADFFNVPIIFPTASLEEVAGIGEYVFQLALSPEKIGEGIAEYAVLEMGLEYFFILSPDDKYGVSVSESFQSKVENLGGRIVEVEYYPRGATDFGSYLSALRDILLEQEEGEPIPEEEIPVYLDGVFVPGYPEEVVSIAPQIRFNKIETKILGTDGWGEKKVLDLARDYVEGVVFASEFSHLDYDSSFASFENDYRYAYKKNPSKPAIMGYKAAILLSSAIRDDHDPRRIQKNLLSLGNTDQARYVNFNPQGANNLFYIYIIRNGEFKKLK